MAWTMGTADEWLRADFDAELVLVSDDGETVEWEIPLASHDNPDEYAEKRP